MLRAIIYLHAVDGVTKHESRFRCSLARGFPSGDRRSLLHGRDPGRHGHFLSFPGSALIFTHKSRWTPGLCPVDSDATLIQRATGRRRR